MSQSERDQRIDAGNLPANIFVHDVQRISSRPLMGGGFADIWQGEFRGRPVALKELRIFDRSGDEFLKAQRRFFREALVWKELNHPNVLPFYGVLSNNFGLKLAMVSPWMVHGNLVTYLKNATKNVDRLKLVQGSASGLAYLHGSRIVHGDFRGANILIDERGDPCIADFGLARIVESDQSRGPLGAIRWQAPELFNFEEDTNVILTMQSDVYAFACVCLEIFTGKVPFSNISVSAVMMAVAVKNQRPPRPKPAASEGLDDNLWTLMEYCWARDPAKRPTMQSVLEWTRARNVAGVTSTNIDDNAGIRDETDALLVGSGNDDTLEQAKNRVLFLSEVESIGDNPVTGSGGVDIRRGEFQGRPVALKVLRVFHYVESFQPIWQKLTSEALRWQKFDHIHLLPFIGIEKELFRPMVVLVSPWMENSDLVEYLIEHQDADRLALAKGTASGLQYLHDLQPAVIHGNLRADNIFIDKDGSPRIANFGQAAVTVYIKASVGSLTYNGRGPMRWQSPEVLDPDKSKGHSGFTVKSDVYAFAGVCYEIYTGTVPFHGLPDHVVVMEVAQKNQRPSRPQDPATNKRLNDRIWNLMKVCWETEPKDRPYVHEMVKALAEISTKKDDSQ
ncbi:kinase-like protein [Rickenella mellea]|uniref:Kinase-like protein n=1 Tax=Rickenella mellea TaxID=50990 RepID=A0A4Y7Q7W5_9AGAM|nr:kinase-like protein [Rickenella mellea]